MEDKKVLIIIPTYNGEKYIKETIDSCLNQSYKNIEVIVIDDCSTDNTVEILRSYGNKIELHVNKTNQGIAKNLNKILLGRTGDFYIFLGQDDILPKDHVKIMVSEFDDNTLFVHCNNIIIDKDGKKIRLAKDDNIQIEKTKNCLFELSIDNFIDSCGMMHRVDIFQKINGLEEKWKNYTEWMQYIKELSLNEGIPKYTTKTRALYRRHETNITHTMIYDKLFCKCKREARRLAHRLNDNSIEENIKYYMNEISIFLKIFIKRIIFWDKIRPFIKRSNTK